MRDWQLHEKVEGRWEVFGSARGGMGQVYFVRDLQWGGAQLAVKSLLVRAGQPPSNRAKALFLRESQVWLDLGAHPNIVSGFYALEIEGVLRFFMEYVPGVPLSSLVSSGKQTLPRALDFALQLALGLDYIHAKDVVHRDLKPQNCIVSEKDALRVTDFGLGKQLNTDEQPAETQETLANLSAAGLGTPLYMAPEQWMGLSHAGKPADVYAFGVVLYELLGGVHPFGNDSDSWRRYSKRVPEPLTALLESDSPSMLSVLQMMHQEVAPISLTELGVEAPASLLLLTTRCLEKDPSKRPSFHEIKQELLFLYNSLLGIRYPRSLPPNMEPLTSGENNRAVSYYIMKNTAKAKEILSRQLSRDENALYLKLNEQLLRLSCGELLPTTAALESHRFLRLMHPNATQDQQLEQLQQKFSAYLFLPNRPTAFSYCKSTFAVGASDGTISLWSTTTHQRLSSFQVSHEGIQGLSLSGDGAQILVCFADHTVKLLSTKTEKEIQSFATEGEHINASTLSADASLVALSGAEPHIKIFEAKGGTLLLKALAHDGRLSVVTFSPDSQLLATSSFDCTIKIWRLSRGFFGWRLTLLHTILKHQEVVSGLAFSSDARLLVSSGLDGLCLVYSLEEKKIIHARKSEVPILSIAISPESDMVLLGYQDGSVLRFRLDNQEAPFEYEGHQKPVWSVSFGGGRHEFFSSSEEGVARWNTEEPVRDWPLLLEKSLSAPVQIAQEQERAKLLQQLRAGDTQAASLAQAFAALERLRQESPQRQRDPEILSALHSAGKMFGARFGLRDIFVKKSFAQVRRAVFSSRHHLLLFNSRGPLLYSLHPELSSRTLQGHSGELLDAAFSDDATELITSAKDNTIRLWEDLEPLSREPIFPVSTLQHPSWVTAVCFVNASDTFATACQKKVYFWHRGEDTPRWESPECSSWVTSLFASQNGAQLFVCCSDGSYLCLSIRNGERLFGAKASTAEEFGSWRDLSPKPVGCPPILSTDATLLCAAGNDVLLRDAVTHEALQLFRGTRATIRAMARSLDHRFVLVGTADKKALLFSALGERQGVFEEHQRAVGAVTFSWDSFCVVTSDEAMLIRVYQNNGALLYTLEAPFIAEQLSFDPSGRFLLAQGENQARLWEIVSDWNIR
jgi:serine/threonine protein kinase